MLGKRLADVEAWGVTRNIFVVFLFLTLTSNGQAQQPAPVKSAVEFHCTSTMANPSLEFDFAVFSSDGILSSTGIDRVEFQNVIMDDITIRRLSSFKSQMINVSSPPGFVGYFLLSAAAKDTNSDAEISLGSAIKIREPIDGGRILSDEDFLASSSLSITQKSKKRTFEYSCIKIKGTTFK
jgi:hypothetical protein